MLGRSNRRPGSPPGRSGNRVAGEDPRRPGSRAVADPAELPWSDRASSSPSPQPCRPSCCAFPQPRPAPRARRVRQRRRSRPRRRTCRSFGRDPVPAQRPARQPPHALAAQQPVARPCGRQLLDGDGPRAASSTTSPPAARRSSRASTARRYLVGVRGWALGENIAYGTGADASPQVDRLDVDALGRPSGEHPQRAATATSESAPRSARRSRSAAPATRRRTRPTSASAVADRRQPATIVNAIAVRRRAVAGGVDRGQRRAVAARAPACRLPIRPLNATLHVPLGDGVNERSGGDQARAAPSVGQASGGAHAAPVATTAAGLGDDRDRDARGLGEA